MSDDLALFAVDVRGQYSQSEVLIYKLETDKWGKAYYTPSALPPMKPEDARLLGIALLTVTAPEPPTL